MKSVGVDVVDAWTTTTTSKLPRPFSLQKVESVVFHCQNLSNMVHFYSHVLGCSRVNEHHQPSNVDDDQERPGRMVRLQVGDDNIYHNSGSYTILDLIQVDANYTERHRHQSLPPKQPPPVPPQQETIDTSGGVSHTFQEYSIVEDNIPPFPYCLSLRIHLPNNSSSTSPSTSSPLLAYLQSHQVPILATTSSLPSHKEDGRQEGQQQKQKQKQKQQSLWYIQDPENHILQLVVIEPESSPLPSSSSSSSSSSSFTINKPQITLTDSNKYAIFHNTTNSSIVQRDGTKNDDKDDLIQDPGVSKTTVSPPTPCIRICRYNANIYQGQVCIGCFREAYEIGTWSSMTPLEKYYTLLDAADRCKIIQQQHVHTQDNNNNNNNNNNNYNNEKDYHGAGSISRQELLQQANAWYECHQQNQ